VAAAAPTPILTPNAPLPFHPTPQYNHKTRLGKGFTMQELKEAGISPKYAKSVGIAVDHRRTNLSVRSLAFCRLP
jgi:large subunit ribosomal protein L13e